MGAPIVEWKKIDWSDHKPNYPILTSPNPGAPQTQEESGSEWWYDVAKSIDESGRNDGFYASGFANWHDLTINEQLANGCYINSPTGTPECAYPKLSGQPVSNNLATVGKYDHKGNMIWCKSACLAGEGAFSLTTTDDGSIYFTGFGRVSRDVHGNVIQLNPRPSDPDGDDISALGYCNENASKVIVGKFDREGNLLWINQYMPGDINNDPANDIDVLDNETSGWAITDIPGTNDVKVAAFHTGNDGIRKLFVFDVDENGLLIPGSRKVHGNGSLSFSVKYITPEGNGDYLISGYQPSASSSGSDAVLLRIDSNNDLKPISSYPWGGTNAAIRYNNSGTHNIGQDVVVANNGNIIWAIIEDCSDCRFSGNNYGKGKLILFDSNGNYSSTKDLQIESNFGCTCI